MTQARLISDDTAASTAQVMGITNNRRVAVRSAFSAARVNLTAFFTGTIARVQAFITARQVEATAAATRALSTISSAIAAALTTAQALAITARTQIGAAVDRVTESVHGQVAGLAERITALVDTIPAPDIPGVSQLRSAAVRLINGAVRLVNRALSGLGKFIQSALQVGLEFVASVLNLIGQAAAAVLAAVAAAIAGLIAAISQALRSAVTVVGAAVMTALTTIVIPMLVTLEVLIVGLIDASSQAAIGLLRANREQYLQAIAEGLESSGSRPSMRASSEADAQAALRQLRQLSLENDRRIVQTFEMQPARAILQVIAAMWTWAARVIAALAASVSQLFRAIAAMIVVLAQLALLLVSSVADFLADMFRSITALFVSLIAFFSPTLGAAAKKLVDFVQSAVSRLVSFVAGFIRDLLLGRGSVPGDLVGEYAPETLTVPPVLAKGPIVKPPPADVIIRLILQGLAALALVFSAIVAFLAGTITIIIGGWTITISVGLLLLILVVVLVIVGLLLWLLWRWLTKPKPPPTKRVIAVTPSVLELGVGGRDISSAATIAPGVPAVPRLRWSINPGGTIPKGIRVIGSGVRVAVRAGQPPHGAVTGGAPITIRAALASNPTDFADSAAVMVVQVVTALYRAVPALANVPSAIAGIFPPNTGEPNRDGIGGNTAVVEPTTAPAARPIGVAFRRALGATVAGATVTPGTTTGDIGLRITDTATLARLDETKRSTVGPARLMADMTINAAPLRVNGLKFVGRDPLGPYSIRSKIDYAESDRLHRPLTRIVGELITGVTDDFNVPAPNGAFNPGFRLDLAVPADTWTDRLVAPAGMQIVGTAQIAIDVNRFVGPGVPPLPRSLIYRQRFVYASWAGGGAITSGVIDDGQHIKILFGKPPAAFKFSTEHRFGGISNKPAAERYAGPPLIILSNVRATPTAPGATGLAADGAATANLFVTSNVAGRSVNWSVLSGGLAVIAGNPAVLPAPATLRAGGAVGTFGVRAQDTAFANRQVDGPVKVVAVTFRRMRASPAVVRGGGLNSTVSLIADPGGRTVNWSVDAAAAAAGVTVTPNLTGPGAAGMTVRVTRPAGFSGTVTVTAADTVLAAATSSVRIDFR